MTLSYHGQMVTKKNYNMQSRSQPLKPKVTVIVGMIKCKKYPKTVLNYLSKEKQMQMRKKCVSNKASCLLCGILEVMPSPLEPA